MGANGNDDLQEQEDAWARTSAEQDYVESGGTGYYDEDRYGYNAQDSSPLTDIDYQPNDESSAFTGNYTGAEDYDPVSRDDDNDDDDDNSFDDDDEDNAGWGGYRDDNDEQENFDRDGGNFDGNDEENTKSEKNKDDEDEEDDAGDDVGNADPDNQGNGNKGKKQNVDDGEADLAAFEKKTAMRFWREGEPVTLEVLASHWEIFRQHLPELRPMMDEADLLIEEALATTGPNLVLKLNKWIAKVGDQEQGMTSSILKLISRPGLLWAYGTAAVAEALVDQQWLQVVLLFGLKKALTEALNIGFVQNFMQKLFSKAIKEIKAKLKGGK